MYVSEKNVEYFSAISRTIETLDVSKKFTFSVWRKYRNQSNFGDLIVIQCNTYNTLNLLAGILFSHYHVRFENVFLLLR